MVVSPVVADHRITVRTTMADPAMSSFKMTNVTSTKNKRQRIEDTTEISGHATTQIRLVMCDTEQEALLDPEDRIYTVRPLKPGGISDSVNPTEPAKKGSGKIETQVRVEDRGSERLADFDTRHWWVDSKIKGSGCVGDFEHETQREVWTTASLPTFECPLLNDNWTTSSWDGCTCTNVVTGDVEQYRLSTKGQVVKEVIYQNGKPMMTRELIDYSTAELDQTLFSLEGYREVSQSEFDRVLKDRIAKAYSR